MGSLVISMLSTALGKMMFFTLSFIFLLFSTTNNYATAHSYHTHDVVTTTTQGPDGDDEKCSLNPMHHNVGHADEMVSVGPRVCLNTDTYAKALPAVLGRIPLSRHLPLIAS